nr:AI-2E family transporter [Lachnospiraceae bacterium]
GIIASYLFIAERDYMQATIKKLLPSSIMKRSEIVLSTMKNAVGAYFAAQFKIMGVIYVMLLIGLLILKAKYAPLIGIIIAMLDFLPFLGTGTVMLPWAIVKFIQQDYRMGAGILILWAITQAVRQFIQPKFVGDSMGIAPIPTIILLYVGFRVGGPIGLIFAVPIGMIVINLYKAGVFSNFSYSIQLLFKDMNRFRRFNEAELVSEGIEIVGSPADPKEIEDKEESDTDQ